MSDRSELAMRYVSRVAWAASVLIFLNFANDYQSIRHRTELDSHQRQIEATVAELSEITTRLERMTADGKADRAELRKLATELRARLDRLEAGGGIAAR